jgi:hypothetical protein
VPAGFHTDLASIPPAFRWLIAPYGKYTKAAILHDYLLHERVVSVADADGIFRRSMRELDVSFLRRWMMWAAVRAAHRLSGATAGEVVAWLLVTIPSLLFLALPAVVVIVWLSLFWVLEYVVFAGLLPTKHHAKNKPHWLLAADAVKKRR